MSRHSKSASSRPFLTVGERKKLASGSEYGTKVQRLGSDSMSPFFFCCLCLKAANKPVVATPHGYIYCKECLLENFVKQKKNHVKTLEQWEFAKKQRELAEELEKKEKERALREKFESITATSSTMSSSSSLSIAMNNNNNNNVENESRSLIKNWKSNLGGTTSLQFISTTMESKQNTTQYNDDSSSSIENHPKLETIDPSCGKPLRLKQMIEVHFTFSPNSNALEDNEKEHMKDIICSCCSKSFAKGLKGYVIKSCGHCLCAICVKQFEKSKDLFCTQCNNEKVEKKDLLEIIAGGTAFSASSGDKSEAKSWKPQLLYS